MEGATINPVAYVQSTPLLCLFALGDPAFFTSSLEFYAVFLRETEKHILEYVKMYDEDMNTAMTLVSTIPPLPALTVAPICFSGPWKQAIPLTLVAALFLLNVQGKSKLQERIQALKIGDIPASADTIIPWRHCPDLTTVHRIHLVLCFTLAAFGYAVFIAMLGKQWLTHYAEVLDTRGSIIDRGRYRQSRMNAMVTWRFDYVIQLPMFFVQAGLMLLGYSLSVYLFLTGEVLAGIAVGFIAFGLLFHIRECRSGLKGVTCVGSNRNVRR